MSRLPRREWYRRVNTAWPPAIPPLTAPEAVRAVRRLYRYGTGRTFRGTVKLTSGRRWSRILRGVWRINPERGWHDLVHLLSHYCDASGGHNADHARLELRMIKQVLRRGWLDGRLRDAERPPAPPVDRRARKLERLRARLKAWEAKQRRAIRAIAKIRRQLRRLEGLAPAGPVRHDARSGSPTHGGDIMTRTLLVLAAVVSLAASPPPADGQAHYRQRGKAVLNDSTYTPGDTLTTDTAVVCHRKTGTVRAVSEKEKREVFTLYGLPPTGHKTGAYEVDHLISLELGGSNAITNLWPEPAAPKPGFHQKDVLENTLHRMACSGAISLRAAQVAIATDWTVPYVAYVLHYKDDAGS